MRCPGFETIDKDEGEVRMIQWLLKLWAEEEGQNLPEFALLLFLVCLTAVSAMGSVAIKVDGMYYTISTHMAAAGNPALTGGSTSYAVETPAETQDEIKNERKRKCTNQ